MMNRPTAVARGLVTDAFALGLAIALVAGCATGGPASTTTPTTTTTGTPSAGALRSPVTGVVVSVDSAGVGDVKGFTLRTADGTTATFRIGILENGAEFPPGHLTEHVVSAEPVRIFFSQDGGDLVVHRIEDAG